jgi:hypothetical protein
MLHIINTYFISVTDFRLLMDINKVNQEESGFNRIGIEIYKSH